MTKDMELINDDLIRVYGRNTFNKPLFRLVWSSTPTEMVYGTFDRFCGSIFLCTETGIKERRKYPTNLWGECYILEKVQDCLPPSNVMNWNGYEAIWAFKNDKTNEVFTPNWRVVNFIIQSLSNPVQTLSQAFDAEEGKWKKEAELVKEMLDDELPFKTMQLKHGEGVVVPSNYIKED